MSAIVERFKSQITSSKSRTGRVVIVYDGRIWPVVKCGAVYVTDEDKTKVVTKKVIAQSEAPEDKKKKSSKYTLAVGSSFGHVHSFLKDSEHVLTSLDKHKAEDKCLMLIRKPKSASKQMLKAHSWANLSTPDMHLRQPDGSLNKDQYKLANNRGLRKPGELSLPPEATTRGHHKHNSKSTNQNTPLKATTNHSASFKELSSVYELEEDSKSDILPRKHNKLTDSGTKLANSYPFDKSSNLYKHEHIKASSVTDLRQQNPEINNNNMGGALSQGKPRPRVPPPAVPNSNTIPRTTDTQNKYPDNVQVIRHEQYRQQSHPGDVKDIKNNNRPDIISNVIVDSRTGGHNKTVDNRSQGNVNIKTEGYNSNKYSHSRVKHDSGFHSEARISNDEMYDVGFRQELTAKTNNGGKVTSSPVDNRTKSVGRKVFGSVDNISMYVSRDPQYNLNGQGNRHVSQSNKNINSGSIDNLRYNASNTGNQRPIEQYNNMEGQRHGGKKYSPQNANEEPIYAKAQKRNSNPQPQTKDIYGTNGSVHSEKIASQHNKPRVSGSSSSKSETDYRMDKQRMVKSDTVKKRSSSKGEIDYRRNEIQGDQNMKSEYSKSETDSRQHNKTKSNKDYNKRQSMGDIKEENNKISHESEEAVIRAHSMGDLNVGCTFSLIGQKKEESSCSVAETEFTGSQLAKHFRKYRGMKQESKHGSLPFRGKSVEEDDYPRKSLNDIQSQYDLSAKPEELTTYQKPTHYSSLQHIPSHGEQIENKQRQCISARHRENTPMKPRRSLPQVPGNVDEKKKQMANLVQTRASSSRNSRSSTSPGSRNSNRTSSGMLRQGGGVSATPSDREVSGYLGYRETSWANRADKDTCNKPEPNYSIPPDASYQTQHALHHSDSVGSHDHISGNYIIPPGGRLSDSGQTTLTSQSTIDSGYTTTDQEHDTLSTSNYAITLKQSAQNLYSGNKHFQLAKGEHSNQSQNSNIKGGNLNHKPIKSGNSPHSKDSHTRNWLEQHPGYISDYLNPGTGVQNSSNQQNYSNIDTNNNKHNSLPNTIPEHEMVSVNNENMDYKAVKQTESKPHPKVPLFHHFSEPGPRDLDRLNIKEGLPHKFKSVSMSQGLNLIEQANSSQCGNFLSKSQPKFTGSLKDLIGADRHIVPVETLKIDSVRSTGTLPGSWKFESGIKLEASLKSLGKPSLFQLLQNYTLYAVRMMIPDGFQVMDNVRLIECEVVLPSPWLHGKESEQRVTSPKGSYAKIGGPNSAFRPVAKENCPIKSVSMVTIMDVTNQLTQTLESGQFNKGDLVVEVNERLMMGEDLATLTSTLNSCHGEVIFTIARDKARDTQQRSTRNVTSSSPTEDDFCAMEEKINELLKELQRKDRTLKQLNALLPWKQSDVKGQNSDDREQESYLCNLSEDEFIV